MSLDNLFDSSGQVLSIQKTSKLVDLLTNQSFRIRKESTISLEDFFRIRKFCSLFKAISSVYGRNPPRNLPYTEEFEQIRAFNFLIRKLDVLKCYHCYKTWTPRQLPVTKCPSCKSTNFKVSVLGSLSGDKVIGAST